MLCSLGGFGAAKNLSTFAFENENGTIDPDVKRVINDFHNGGKPVGAVCIAPAVFGFGKGKVTIGTDQERQMHLSHLEAPIKTVL